VSPGGTGVSEEARRQVHEVSASARVRPGRTTSSSRARPFSSGPPARTCRPRPRRDVLPALGGPAVPALAPQPRRPPDLRALPLVRDRREPYPPSRGSEPERYETVAEAKLGAALEFKFGTAGLISLGGVLDLDKPGKAWDGGSVKAMFLF